MCSGHKILLMLLARPIFLHQHTISTGYVVTELANCIAVSDIIWGVQIINNLIQIPISIMQRETEREREGKFQ